MAKVIGLTCDGESEGQKFILNSSYVVAILRAGGLPVIIPPTSCEMAEKYLQVIDGLLLTGGGDIEPGFYGEKPREGLGRVFRERDEFELYLAQRALFLGKPILAICRGLQVLNVASGGTLYQDIVKEVGSHLHNPGGPRSVPHHRVRIFPGTRLYTWLGPEAKVNSMHHQAVCLLGRGLKISAVAEDGLIEAVEGTGDSFVVGVQWHPEELTASCPEQQALFKNFVAAADIST